MTDTTPTTPEPSRHAARTPRRRRRMIAIVAGGLVAAAAIGAGVVLSTGGGEVVAAAVAPAAADGYKAPASSATAKLPAAVYDAVIPGLLDAMASKGKSGRQVDVDRSFTIAADAPLYGADRNTAVARLQAKDFLGDPTTVVPVRTSGSWTLVLTPARVQLPSKANGNAAAQSAGWIRTSLLTKGHTLDTRVAVSVAKQTLTITRGDQTVSYKVGVGTPDAPTPTGVTGYLQARYLDPKQGQSTYPIQLTSLHSAAQDEPYRGDDGGLIGAHYADTASGAVSHGCIRLTHAAVAAVNQLPLGTPITINK